MTNKTLFVNFFAAPGVGKSRMMAGVFSRLKFMGIDCEQVGEFAKEVLWEGRHETMQDEVYLTAKQNHRLFRLNGKTNIVITDRPLPLTEIYNPNYDELNALTMKMFNSYWNMNILLVRNDDNGYNPNGRLQSEDESRAMDARIEELLVRRGIPFARYTAAEENIREIACDIDAAFRLDNRLKGE